VTRTVQFEEGGAAPWEKRCYTLVLKASVL
jgi:hypothetical protein